MNTRGKDGTSDTDDPDQPHAGDQGKDGLLSDREKNIARREGAVRDDEAAILSREKSATAREDTADTREDAAGVREGTAQTREDEARGRERAATSRELNIRSVGILQTKSDDQTIRLQKASEHLLSAKIEARKLTEQVQTSKADLDHLVHHDALTDLPNRILLQDRLGQAIESARRHDWQLAVMFIDLNRFRYINDSLGHAVGDQLLRSVAQRLTDCVHPTDTVSRQGGNEFALLLPYIARAEDAAIPAQKILRALAPPHCIEGQNLHIGASIGISIYPDDGQDVATLIKCADSAMCHAKENGRNNYQFFEQSINILAVNHQFIESGLRQALERQEFVLHYQPKINLHSGAIAGAEALIRWQHPEQGLLSPAQFVPIAEDCGLILLIDRWVLREACRNARAWQNAGLPPIIVAVNISASEFRAGDFVENIRKTLADTGLEPYYLELELTESMLMQNAEATGSVLQVLGKLGIKLAIDDFGTGYSSLGYLRKFPVDTLKIDQSFVNQMAENPGDAVIVSAVIGMAKNLKLRVIAEGVETAEQYAFLRAQHCDEGQGYYFGRPVEEKTFAALLRTGISLTPPDADPGIDHILSELPYR